MRSRWNFLIVLVYGGIALGILSFLTVNMAGPCAKLGPFDPAHCITLNAEFTDSAGLLATDDVDIAGTKVGQVTGISVDGKVARVAMQVQGSYLPLHKDATALVRPKNLLGVTYVELGKGSAGSGDLGDGDTIPLVNTITPVQVDEVLNALDLDTRSKLQLVINALGEATAQRGQDMNLSASDLRRIAADVAVTSTTLDEQKDNLGALLTQLDLYQKTVADYHDQLAQTLRDWNDQSTTLMRHDVQLANAFGHLNNVLASLDAGLTPNAPALASAVAKLPQTVADAKDFLATSSTITDTFQSYPNGSGGLTVDPNGPTALRNGIAIFPRLAQTMLGTNRCDDHIYTNGYFNVPGVTEPASCPSPVTNPATMKPGGGRLVAADPALSIEGFSAQSGPNLSGIPNNYVSQDHHLWRVMGMVAPDEAQCGLKSPGMSPSSVCSPGNTGISAYSPPSPTGSATVSGATASTSTSDGGPFGFFGRLWSDLFGGAHA